MKVKVFEWLKGDGNAFIEIPQHIEFAKFKVNVANADNRNQFVCGWNGDLRIRGRDKAFINAHNTFVYTTEPLVSVEVYSDRIIVDEATYTSAMESSDYSFTKGDVFRFFQRNALLNYLDYTGAFGLSAVETDTLHLVPCLTEDGEACMINLMNGELFKNQGSGAFSVEGECLFEFETPVVKQVMKKPSIIVRLRKWINNEGKAFILTNKIINETDYNLDVRFKAFPINVPSSGVTYQFLTGCRLEDNSNTLPASTIVLGTSAVRGNFWIRVNYSGMPEYYGRCEYGEDTTLRVDWNARKTYVNDQVFDTYKERATPQNHGVTVFSQIAYNGTPTTFRNGATINPFNGSIAHFRMTHKDTGEVLLDLRPCDILLHPTLPPQSAMIDLRTGDLYTNQGSGKFTCEGEDFGIWTDTLYDDMRIKDTKADMVCVMNNGEPRVVWERTQPWVEHRWLVGSSPHLFLHITARNGFDIQPRMPLDNGYTIFSLSGHSVWSAGHAGHPYAVASNGMRYFADTDCFALRYPNPKISVDLINQNINLEGFKEKWYGGSGTYNFYILDGYKAITIDGATLTPVHLTRNLFPSEIASANTALRGECGFADKEKYKRGEPWFYGNRASSGAFGVSDE